MGKGLKLFLSSCLTLGLVGPVLSCFSLQGVDFHTSILVYLPLWIFE